MLKGEIGTLAHALASAKGLVAVGLVLGIDQVTDFAASSSVENALYGVGNGPIANDLAEKSSGSLAGDAVAGGDGALGSLNTTFSQLDLLMRNLIHAQRKLRALYSVCCR